MHFISFGYLAETSFRPIDEILNEKKERDDQIVAAHKKRCLAQIIKTAGQHKKQRPQTRHPDPP